MTDKVNTEAKKWPFQQGKDRFRQERSLRRRIRTFQQAEWTNGPLCYRRKSVEREKSADEACKDFVGQRKWCFKFEELKAFNGEKKSLREK